jgi:CubicO group peptidase (beta-lactamase class C family)
VPSAFEDAQRGERFRALAPTVDALVKTEQEAQRLPGLTVGVVVDGMLVLQAASGVRDVERGLPIERSTLFEIASVTKTFTTTAVLALRDQGRLELDDPIARHLPELAGVVYPNGDDPPISIRHLLTHTSGLPNTGRFAYDADSAPTAGEVLRSFEGLGLESSPGERFSYSNVGFTVLALLVERIAKAPYERYVGERVLSPLGMASSGFAPAAATKATGYERDKGEVRAARSKKRGGAGGSGGLWSSVDDLSRFVAFQLDAWPARAGAESGPVRRSTRRESHTLQANRGLKVRRSEQATDIETRGVGLGWQVYEDCTFDRVAWHNGKTSGFSSAIYLVPANGVGVIVLSNGDGDADKVARGVLAKLSEAGVLIERTPRASEAFLSSAKRAVDLRAQWDEAAHRALFSPAHRAALPAAKLRAYFEASLRRHGACRFERVLEVRAPGEVVLRYACDKGAIEAEVEGSSVGAIEVARLKLVSRGIEGSEESDRPARPSKCR